MGISVVQAAQFGAKKAPLAEGEIHLWLADLCVPEPRLAALAATLSADEQERAGRFRFPEHRDRFIAARGGLRELLSAYLGVAAATLRFQQEARGKPALVDNAANLHFNLSHSGDRVLYAVARRAVGVDLEIIERRVDITAVAERICTAREWSAFQTLSAERQREAFFTCWTRKEAVAKATGAGLAGGLNTLGVCFQQAALRNGRSSWRDAAGQEWSVLNLPMEHGWAGALAAAGSDWQWMQGASHFADGVPPQPRQF